MTADGAGETTTDTCFILQYPGAVASVVGSGQTEFQVLHMRWENAGVSQWHPFKGKDEWELAEWLMRRVGKCGLEEFVNLNFVCDFRLLYTMPELISDIQIKQAQPSFQSAFTFFKKVDLLPVGPRWNCQIVKITGDLDGLNDEPLSEEVELWLWDPVECIAKLIANPAFNGSIAHEPEQVHADHMGKFRIYDEM